MSRDDRGQGRERSEQERERARLEREARRSGGRPPDPRPPARAAGPPPPPPPPSPIPISRPPRAQRTAPEQQPTAPRVRKRAAEQPGERKRPAPRRIQPQPPAPPAAPGGALRDETGRERPIGIRRAGRPSRAVMTPPGNRRSGPARARGVRTRLIGFLALALLAFVVVGVVMLFQPFGSAEGAQVEVTIAPGASAGDVGDKLADAGVVSSGTLFSIRATIAGKRGSLRSGPHTLRRSMTYGAAIEALTTTPAAPAKPATIKVTIPEGRSRREIVPIAERADLRGDYLTASKRFAGALNPFRYGAPQGTRSLEGFLFPATYELAVGADARTLVEDQLKAFEDNFASVDLRGAKRRNLSAYDVLIIASMVEREAKLAGERPKIAAVIYNRLKDGTPLGIDATTRYELGKWSGELTQSDLASDSPYNTRKRAGLPPTPIGNPGLASIRAAAEPAKVGFRYFVRKPGTCGEHAFSSTIEQFGRDSQRYAAARAENDRSPDTCP